MTGKYSAQDDYPRIKLEIETVCFFIPNVKANPIVHYELCIDTASCTTSVYVNLSKNSFFRSRTEFLRESGCKGTAFF